MKNVTIEDFLSSGGQAIRRGFKIGRGSPTRGLWMNTLIHNNLVYDKLYGRMDRYCHAHAPFIIDKGIMAHFTNKLEFIVNQTSANKFRTKTDIQFEFNYFNFIIGELSLHALTLYLNELDTNQNKRIDFGKFDTLINIKYTKDVANVITGDR